MDQNNQILIYQSFILSRGMRKEWRTEFENSRIWKAFLFAAGNAPLGNAPSKGNVPFPILAGG